MSKEIFEQNVMVAWFRDLSVDELANFFFLTVSEVKKDWCVQNDLSKANQRAQCFLDFQSNLHVMNTFLFIC